MPDQRRQRNAPSGYGASGNRSTLGYWVPLVLTVTAATVGIAAWIWSERQDEEEESNSGAYNPGGIPPPGYASMSGGLPPGPGPAGFQGPPPDFQAGQSATAQPGAYGLPPGPGPAGFQGQVTGSSQPGYRGSRDIRSDSAIQQNEDSSFMARVGNAVGITRAPSPGQAYDWASKTFTAGVAAAGAMIGGAAGSSGKDGFDEQRRWSEEAEQRDSGRDFKLNRRGTAEEFYSGAVTLPRSMSLNNQKRKTVAIVVSSVQSNSNSDIDIGGHASILSHLPEYVHPETTRIFVLIYTPTMTVHPLSPAASGRRLSQSRNSSFSNISATDAQHTPAQTPGEFPLGDQDGILSTLDPRPIEETTSTLYKTLHNQALALVDRDTMIMPFSSLQGHKHILKSLQPEIAYIQESLCGTDGEVVSELGRWVRTCVVVIGDEEGTGGLVDTDEEVEQRRARSRSGSRGGSARKGQEWWKREERTGVGRGVSVVEAIKIGEDWTRRVNEKD